MTYNLELKDNDEVEMLIEILNKEKQRLDEIIKCPGHYPEVLEKARWDLSRVTRMINDLTASYRGNAK